MLDVDYVVADLEVAEVGEEWRGAGAAAGAVSDDRVGFVEEVAGNGWSRTIDLSSQFQEPLLKEKTVGLLLVTLLLVPLTIKLATKHTKSRSTRNVFFVAFVFSWLSR